MSWRVWLPDLRLCGATLPHCAQAIWSLKIRLSTSQFACFFCFVLFELLSFLFLMIGCSEGDCFRGSLILQRRRSNVVHFSLGFSADDRWKTLADRLGVEVHEIRYYDRRKEDPVDAVLRNWEFKGGSTVGNLYDHLVYLELPVIADYL